MNEETKKAAEIAAQLHALEVAKRFSSVPDERISRHDVAKAAKYGHEAGAAWHASHAAKEVAMVDEALKECVAALYGTRACLGDIANISHAIKLAEDALVKNALAKQSAKAGDGKDE